MEVAKLKEMPLSVRVFVSLILCVIGLSYLTLLGSVWVDTEMKISNIMEAYGSFEFTELIEHSFKYIFWFICIFTITVSVLLLTSYPEKLKRFFSFLVPLLIISDIGSMWLIRYWSRAWFSWQLYLSGMSLAVLFLIMFLLINYDIWLKKAK